MNHEIERRTVLSEINVTPLVDVMMVLLVIFMVTAPLIQQGIAVNLPKAQTEPVEPQEDALILTITEDKDIYISGYRSSKKIELDGLEEVVKKIYLNRQKKEIFLKADEKVLYGFVVKIMAIVKKAGIEKVGMITEPEKKI